jgi:hypothetical protein
VVGNGCLKRPAKEEAHVAQQRRRGRGAPPGTVLVLVTGRETEAGEAKPQLPRPAACTAADTATTPKNGREWVDRTNQAKLNRLLRGWGEGSSGGQVTVGKGTPCHSDTGCSLFELPTTHETVPSQVFMRCFLLNEPIATGMCCK